MKKQRYITTALVAAAVLFNSSCKKYLDINTSPNNIVGTPQNAPIPQILSSATVNIGFMGGSFEAINQSLIVQQYSGQSTGTLNQTQDYEKYNMSPSDQNTAWNSYYDTSINDLDIIIAKAKTSSPHYAGVAEILRAYTYQCMVDIWGKIPYTTADQTTANLQPTLDDDAAIYTALLAQIDQGIADINATNPAGALDPNLSSTIFQSSSWTTSKALWLKFAYTLKLRMFLHYSKKDATFTATQINALVSNASATFMASNSDSFQMPFVASAGARNPIYNFEVSRANYLVANAFLLNMMKAKNDPRIPFYFLPVPKTVSTYTGAVGGAPGNAAAYSHIGTYLTGAAGEAPIRMLTFAEYNFIRAEAALRYATPGNSAQQFFTAGITASMADAGVSAANIATYLATNGILTGTTAQQLQQIINEKYTANIEVVCEPWTDWRRTGYPVISPPSNALLTYIPRSFYYPQSETDTNPNVAQKADMSARVFWDVQ